ncbi:MAG: PDGLE domain-containing protein [candidate division WOR-3 bacterium]
MKKLWIALGILAVLAPIGMLAPGTAWGEWGIEELEEMGISVPAGLQRLSDIHPCVLIPDYSLPNLGENFWVQALVYILSGFIGIGICAGLVWLIAFRKKEAGA